MPSRTVRRAGHTRRWLSHWPSRWAGASIPAGSGGGWSASACGSSVRAAVPSGMAYAELAGVSPVAGLYALLSLESHGVATVGETPPGSRSYPSRSQASRTCLRFCWAAQTSPFARLKTPLQVMFDRSGLTTTIGHDNFHPNVEHAVQACAEHPGTT